MPCRITLLEFRKGPGFEIGLVGCVLEGGQVRYRQFYLPDLDEMIYGRSVCFKIGGSVVFQFIIDEDVQRLAHFREHIMREITCMSEKGIGRVVLEWQFLSEQDVSLPQS